MPFPELLVARKSPWADVPAPRDMSDVEIEAEAPSHDPRCKWRNTTGGSPCNCKHWAGVDEAEEDDDDDWEH